MDATEYNMRHLHDSDLGVLARRALVTDPVSEEATRVLALARKEQARRTREGDTARASRMSVLVERGRLGSFFSAAGMIVDNYAEHDTYISFRHYVTGDGCWLYRTVPYGFVLHSDGSVTT